MSPYDPAIFINGVRLTGKVEIFEERTFGVNVSRVHIKAEDFEIVRKDEE